MRCVHRTHRFTTALSVDTFVNGPGDLAAKVWRERRAFGPRLFARWRAAVESVPMIPCVPDWIRERHGMARRFAARRFDFHASGVCQKG